MATKKQAQAKHETEIGDNAVKTGPNVPESDLDRTVTAEDRAKANEEAVGGPEPIVVTEADNPSPGRNAVPVTAEVDDGDENIPGTDLPQPRAPKRGEATR